MWGFIIVIEQSFLLIKGQARGHVSIYEIFGLIATLFMGYLLHEVDDIPINK